MARVAVFHHIGDAGEYTNTLEEILAFDGQVTFDGAYDELWDYKKQLGKLAPIVFVQGNTLNTEGVCSYWRLMDLLDAGFVLGWHGITHRRLTELDDESVKKELRCLFRTVDFYAYPHGDWDGRVAKLVQNAGFKMAFSTTQGEEGNDFAIPREYI